MYRTPSSTSRKSPKPEGSPVIRCIISWVRAESMSFSQATGMTGFSSPSQCILRTSFLRYHSSLLRMVTQTCLTQPAPSISARTAFSPAEMLMKSLFPPSCRN